MIVNRKFTCKLKRSEEVARKASQPPHCVSVDDQGRVHFVNSSLVIHFFLFWFLALPVFAAMGVI